MTRPHPNPDFGLTKELPADIRRKRRLVRVMLYWERIWMALWPSVALAGFFVIAALSDLFSMLPFWLHAVILALFAGLMVLALKPLLQVSIPTRSQALKRLELKNDLRHRPLTSLSDTLTLGLDDSDTIRLWAAHKQELLLNINTLKTGWPKTEMAAHDPFALRAVLLLGLFVAMVYAGDSARERLGGALWPVNGFGAPPVSLDAWITPPSYTRRPPVFLSEGLFSGASEDSPPVHVPRGSELVARVQGVSNPVLTGMRSAGGPLRFERKEAGFWEVKTVLDRGVQLGVRSSGQTIANWDVEVVPDRAPRIRLIEPPSVTSSGVLKLAYEIADDYGVQSAEARFSLVEGSSKEDQYRDNAFSPPDFSLILPGQMPKSGQSTIFKDLTAHPWAGMDVQLTLVVRDEAGQEGQSSISSLRLPERNFLKPLAQAVVEQRRKLARDSDNRWDVGNALSALTIAPERFLDDTTVFLGLRAAYRHLHRIEKDIDSAEILHLLWDIALRIEDDGLSLAARELRAAQDALRRALQRKESSEQIARLVSRLKQALSNYMAALRKQGGKSKAQTRSQTGAGRIVRPEDLMRMIEQIEQMARSGGAGAAADMLAKLQSILENLQTGRAGQANSQTRAMNRWLEKLDNLMRDQQKLMEDSFRQGKGNNLSHPLEDNAANRDGFADRQQRLRNTLNQMRRGLGQMGLSQPDMFGEAAKAMKRAEGQLREGKSARAARNQGAALDHLRRGMRGLARQMMERMAGTAPGRGIADPLGRPVNGRGKASINKQRGLDKERLGHAYEIRKELEKRLGERGRPVIERRYLERLLRQF